MMCGVLSALSTRDLRVSEVIQLSLCFFKSHLEVGWCISLIHVVLYASVRQLAALKMSKALDFNILILLIQLQGTETSRIQFVLLRSWSSVRLARDWEFVPSAHRERELLTSPPRVSAVLHCVSDAGHECISAVSAVTESPGHPVRS